MGLFNSNLSDFITGKKDGVYRAGGDGASRLTLPEILGAGSIALGGNYGTSKTYTDLPTTMKENLTSNGQMMIAQVVGIPVAVRVLKKMLAKPLINPANRMIRRVGINEVKI
jgi:hypothetical protein